MTTIKKGNIFAHAKGGQRVIFKAGPAKPKRAANPIKKTARKPADKKAAPAKREFKYCLQYKAKPTDPFWKKIAGMNDAEGIKTLARRYAKNYPTYTFQVV